jgi:hypothetical protein
MRFRVGPVLRLNLLVQKENPMALLTIPDINRELQERVQAALNHWIGPCYAKSYEHITARANECGEVWLWGLSADPDIVDEAVALTEEVPGVRCVLNLVTMMYSGSFTFLDR